jgi:hypothetical protein
MQTRKSGIDRRLPDGCPLLNVSMTLQARSLSPTADALPDWREQPHDDLVLAVAIAARLSERQRQFIAPFAMVLDPGLLWVRRWWPTTVTARP